MENETMTTDNNLLTLLLATGVLGNNKHDDHDLTEIKSSLQSLGNGLCAIQYETAKTFADLSAQVSSCCCNTQVAISESKHDTNRNIDQLRFDMTQQYSQLRHESEKQSCDIIRNDDKNTRDVLERMSNDKVGALEAQLLEAKSAYNNQVQTQVLLDAMKGHRD